MRLIALALTGAMLSAIQAEGRLAPQPRTRVVVELFTSQGCSSCPPADDLLRRMIREQPIPAVEVVALSEHVDYWNQLGWRDPFSSARFTARQELYTQQFDGNGNYTPQVVVDGRLQALGNDWAAVSKALIAAASAPKAVVDVSARSAAGGRVTVAVAVSNTPPDPSGDVDVMLAVVENGLVVDVKRGENASRRLEHDAVVRRLEKIGTLARDTHAGAFTATVAVPSGWRATSLKVVAFLQHRRSGRIVGASAATSID